MYVPYDLGLSPSMSSAACIDAVEAVDEFSTWLQGSIGSPAMLDLKVTVQYGGERTHSPVWCFITVLFSLSF